MTLAFFLLSFLVICNCEPVKTFHNHKVLRLGVTDLDDLSFLYNQYETNRSLDFWIEPLALGNIDIRIPPELYSSFTQTLSDRSIPYGTLIENVQELIDQQSIRHTDAFSLTQYNTLADIQTWQRSLPQEFPGLVSVVTIGTSYQERPLLVLRITSPSGTKPRAVWYDGGIHAREWISPATVIWMTYELLTNYVNGDAQAVQILDNLEVYVLPVFNVDGYVYTHTNDRMWRKTRKPNPGSTCVGTDPNRNWGYQWGGAGASTNPCSETFRGSAPFSEVEVKAVSDFLKASGKMKGYINWHSYSQLWLSPWGYTGEYPTDYDKQIKSAEASVQALTSLYGTRYTYGPTYTTIYPASGVSNDWTYGELKIVYSYAPELRDTGEYGFLLPPNQIASSGAETYLALLAWFDSIIQDPDTLL